MLSFLAGLWSGFLSFLSILSPFGESSAWRRPWLRWVLHFLAIVLIVILLYVLNSVFEFENNLPTLPPWTRVHFLPVIFLLVYLFLWTAWWIWKLVMAEPPPSTFPDIDAAWAEAVHTLAQAG